MAVLTVHGVLCVLGTALVILPHVNLGLLSDYKICGDSACESMISSAQAIRDHQGKDCRFLSFRRGDTIFVYHKLTGKREDLWAGSIDRQFGYFPKDAVQEEQVFAAIEKVVETRKSDFFCMDEFGYPTDSTHLDSDDEAADDESDKDIPIHKSEFTQTESSLESAVPDPTESTVSAQEAEGNEEKNSADPAEDTQNTAALDEQGGSPSSAWLSSSMTGWLGLTKEELPDNSAEEQKEDENKDSQAQDSLASSVTSWLTLSREGKPDDVKESVEIGEETADSVASSIGGWLGFSSVKKTDSANEAKEEPVETFRSRRISLDLEGSQLDAEEEKDTGTLSWLRNGLTSTLGLDSSNKDSSYDTSVEEADKDEKEPPSSSWMEIGGILGFKKDNSGDENDHAENDLKENRNDEDMAILENVVTSQSQPALTDDVKTDQSNLEQPPEDQNGHSNVQNGDMEIKEDELFEKDQNRNNEVTSEETMDEDHEQNNETMEQKQQEIQMPVGSNQDSTTQADMYLSPDHTFRSSIGEGKAEDEKDPVSVETGSDGVYHEGAGSIEEEALSHKEILSTQTEELADESQISSEQSQLSFVFSSDKSSDPAQAGNSSFASHGEATNEDDTDTEAVIDINVETETSYVGLAQKKETPSTEGGSQEFTLLNFTSSDTESLMEISSEEEKEQIPFEESTHNPKSDIEGGEDTSEGGRQEIMKEEENRKLEDSMQVEEIKEEVNQEEVEQLEDEERTDNPDESREAEEIKEVDKQDKVEELVDVEGNVKVKDLMMVEEIKKEKPEEVKLLEDGEENERRLDLKEVEEIKKEKPEEVKVLEDGEENERRLDLKEVEEIKKEKPEEVKVLEDGEENEQRLDLKEVEEIKKERQQEVEDLDENVKQHERGDVNEEAVLEEIKEKENKEEDKNRKEQIIMLDLNEDNKDKDVAELTQEHEYVELTESKGEKTVGETELVKEQEKADEEVLKEVEKELAKEETGEKQVQSSQFEVQNNQSDSSRPASDSNEETVQDESFTSSFIESSTKTESPQSEEKWQDEDKKREEVAELEQAEEQHVEGDNLKCSNELCTEGSAKEFVVEEGSTEVVGTSVSEEITEKQSNHTNRTSERELIHSDGETTGETEHTGELGTMEGKVEEKIMEDVIQEELEQSEDEERSDKPEDLKEVEEINEVEKQDKVEELVDEEDLMMVEVIKKEKPEEAKVLEGDEENEQLEDLKGMEEINKERQQEVEGLDESKKLHERDGVKEETVVGISVSEEITEKQSNHTNTTSERELIHSDGETTGETEHTGELGTMEGKVEEEIREDVIQEELEQSEDEGRSDKPEDLKEVEEINEVEKQDKVEELVDEEDLMMVEVIKKEKPEEAKVLEGDEENEQLEDLKGMEEINKERQQEVEGLDESKKLHERDGVKEETVVGISVSEEITEKQSNHTNTTSERELIHSDRETTGETEHTGELGTMEGKVEEEIREDVIQEELEQSEDEGRSDKPEDLKEVEEINEVEKQDKVEELVDEEDLMMVEVIKKEKPEEDLKELEEINKERQQEVEGLDESKKRHERDGVKEETLLEEIKEEEDKEEDETIKEQNIEEENKDSNKNEGSDSWNEEKQEISASDSDLEQSASLGSSLTADHGRDAADSETVGAFGLFKNAFGFFSQTPTTETIDSTEQAQTPNLDVINPSEVPSSLTHKQDLDSAGESSQNQDELVESSTELPQSSTDLHTPSPNPEAPQQSKALCKHYKNLLAHVDAEEMTILLDLFGQHKLQFLDYILSSSEAEDPDGDQSIVSDIERLLEHHREKLVSPSMRIAEAPQEDKGRTRTLVALQKLEVMLESVRKSFHAGQSDVSIHQAEVSCVDASCFTGEELRNTHDPSGNVDNIMHKDEFVVTEGDDGQEWDSQSQQLQEGGMNHFLDFIRQMAEDSVTHSRAVMEHITQVVSTLPDDIRPGPDLYGVPWEPVIFTAVVGLVTVLLFTCRCYSSVKSRMYRSRERWLAQQVAQLLDEKCKVLETVSQHQQEYDDLENSLKDSGVLAQSQKTEQLEAAAEHLAHAKRELERDLQQLKDQLDQQREHRTEQEKQIAALEESMETLGEEIKDLQSQDEQAQTTVKVYNMNSDRLERNQDAAGEENALQQESNAQLKQQVEGWAERVSELEAEMRRYEVAHSGMLQDVANKDERIKSLTDRLLSMKAWDSDLEKEETETANGTAGKGDANESGDTQGHRQKVQKLIYAAKLNADLKSVDEDKDRVFAKLSDEVKAKEDLEVAMKELENEKLLLQSDTEHYSEQVQRLQQKLNIMTEMYQENELKLHRLLTVEEKERLQKEEKLNKADKNIAMAMEELNNYRQRAGEMEEELEKTKQSYHTQISAHEKKAHNNWLAARAADRDLTDIRRENAVLRQKLTDTQFKLDALDKDPYALDSLARPLPFRGERSPYGPSPLGRPASETRPFLSPPTLMEGPPPRLSPRVPRGPGEPPGGQGEMERSGGPHSDSGSISPTWDRRGPPPGPPGPLGPPGYMFRRPPPHPGAMGLLPPPGPLPPRGFPPGPPHPVDLPDGPYRENSLGAAEQEHREQSGPGERKTPPESDPRMGGPPPPGPPMGPMDGPFPRRAPYGPPPPSDFYPPRGPGVPPIMPTWAPPPPGMMLPPRFPPHPHVPPYGAPMRHPPPDGLPPHPMSLPPPRQSLPPPQDNPTSPEDAI